MLNVILPAIQLWGVGAFIVFFIRFNEVSGGQAIGEALVWPWHFVHLAIKSLRDQWPEEK